MPRRGVKVLSQAMPRRPKPHCKLADLACKVFAVGRPHLPEISPICGNECGINFGAIPWERLWDWTLEIP